MTAARPALPTMAAGTLAAILTPLACVPFANLTVPDGSQLLLLAGFGLFNTTMALRCSSSDRVICPG